MSYVVIPISFHTMILLIQSWWELMTMHESGALRLNVSESCDEPSRGLGATTPYFGKVRKMW
jgi:hypothetical protein